MSSTTTPPPPFSTHAKTREEEQPQQPSPEKDITNLLGRFSEIIRANVDHGFTKQTIDDLIDVLAEIQGLGFDVSLPNKILEKSKEVDFDTTQLSPATGEELRNLLLESIHPGNPEELDLEASAVKTNLLLKKLDEVTQLSVESKVKAEEMRKLQEEKDGRKKLENIASAEAIFICGYVVGAVVSALGWFLYQFM